jgi:CO/xanthine dehydrogenase FAD-binding subunit
VTLWQPEGQPPRLAATGIAAYPLRLADAEAHLIDSIDERTIYRAAAAARDAADHPGDFRGDADYRAEMAAVLTRRLLIGLLAG